MKVALLTCWLLALLSGICWMFWQQEWKYSLPTPVPANYNPIKTGDYVSLGDRLKWDNDKPVLIHFFNPACPCSRFNVPYFNSLVKKYDGQFSFAMVVTNTNKSYTAEEVKDKFDVTVPVLFDSTIASSCGVYSTPQAVIIDARGKLYYRGNYNKSRYCTDKNSDYAQMAMDSLLSNNVKPVFSQAALLPYGCQLPNCTR